MVLHSKKIYPLAFFMLKWYNMAVIACINIKSCHSTLYAAKREREIVSLTPTAFFPRRAATTKDIVLEEEESDE